MIFHDRGNPVNITQFIFCASFSKLICAKLRIKWTSAPKFQSNFSSCKNFRNYNRSYSYNRNYNRIRTQHLHMVASSIAEFPNIAFVSAAMADACSMVNLVCLFMKLHLLVLL